METLSTIIEGCKRQDPLAQEKLYREYYAALYALCKTFFADKHDIITALNNGMLNVFRHIDRYQPSQGSFFNWVYTIVRNAAISIVREKRSHLTFELNEQLQEAQTTNPFRQLEWKDIYIYLDVLPPNTRSVCSLFYLEGFSIKEIAASIDMKEGTVKWHLNECRQRLKTIFEQSNHQRLG